MTMFNISPNAKPAEASAGCGKCETCTCSSSQAGHSEPVRTGQAPIQLNILQVAAGQSPGRIGNQPQPPR